MFSDLEILQDFLESTETRYEPGAYSLRGFSGEPKDEAARFLAADEAAQQAAREVVRVIPKDPLLSIPQGQITDATAPAIRELYRSHYDIPAHAIAKRLGVHERTVRRLIAGETFTLRPEPKLNGPSERAKKLRPIVLDMRANGAEYKAITKATGLGAGSILRILGKTRGRK